MSYIKTESPFNFEAPGFLDTAPDDVDLNLIQTVTEKTKTSQSGCGNLISPMLDYSCRKCKSCKKIKPPASFFIQKASGKMVLHKICSTCRNKARESVVSSKSTSTDTTEKRVLELKGINTPFSLILPADHADMSNVDIIDLCKIKPDQIELKGDSVSIPDVNSLYNIYSLEASNLNMMFNINQYICYLSLLNQMSQYPYVPQYPVMTQPTINQNQQQLLQHQKQQQKQSVPVKPVRDATSPTSLKSIINSNVDFTIAFVELKNMIPDIVYNGLKKEYQTQLTIYSNNPQTIFKVLPNSETRKLTLVMELVKFYELLTLTIKCNSCHEIVPKMYCFLHRENYICRECSLKVESHELVDWNCSDDNNNENSNKCFSIQCVRCKHSICYHKYLKYNRNGEIKRQNTCSYCRLKQWRDYYLGISNNGSGSII